MGRTTSRRVILAANALGLAHHAQGDLVVCYRTPILESAYDLGRWGGVDLSAQPDVSGYRYGQAPPEGLSYNYAEDRAEDGLSLAALDNGPEVSSCVWFRDRPMVAISGLLLPDSGSDGEPIVLAYGFEVFD